VNDLDIDLARNTPWVDMTACVKFRLDRRSRLADYTEHRYKQTNIQTNRQTYRLLLYRLFSPLHLSTDPQNVTLNDPEWPFYVKFYF